jgi:hypothetical protein
MISENSSQRELQPRKKIKPVRNEILAECITGRSIGLPKKFILKNLED